MDEEDARPDRRGVPTWAWVLAAVGTAGLFVGTVVVSAAVWWAGRVD